MLKFKVKLKLNDSIEAKCPKHPRFNPEKEGNNIKAGCSTCHTLYDLYRSKLEFERSLRILQRNCAPWLKYRKPRARAANVATITENGPGQEANHASLE